MNNSEKTQISSNELTEYAPDWMDGSFDARPGGGWYKAEDVDALLNHLRGAHETCERQCVCGQQICDVPNWVTIETATMIHCRDSPCYMKPVPGNPHKNEQPPTALPPVPPTWLCPQCKAENHDGYGTCYACGDPRPTAQKAGES